MQRWQRRAHLWLWLFLAFAVMLTLWALIDDRTPRSPATFDDQRP